MTTTIRAEQRQFSKHLNELVAEASSLGLAPGQWPETITVAMDPHGMEPAMDTDFTFRCLERDPDGDIAAAIYSSRLGQDVITLIND
jgi:hypothetical protein